MVFTAAAAPSALVAAEAAESVGLDDGSDAGASASAAAAAASAAQIKELNELNVKLSGHNNQQQVPRAIPSETTNQTQKCNRESRRFTTWKR